MNLPDEDEALIASISTLLSANVDADPYAWDDAFAAQIRKLPRGLRAMAATYFLDVSLTLDDIGWHFLNFGQPGHVEEAEIGLGELGLPELADMFSEAYHMMGPLLPLILGLGEDYYDVTAQAGHASRIKEMSSQAHELLGERGIFRFWAVYAKKHPERVFNL